MWRIEKEGKENRSWQATMIYSFGQTFIIKCECCEIDWIIAFKLLAMFLNLQAKIIHGPEVWADHLPLRKSLCISGKESRLAVDKCVSSLSVFITKSTYLHIQFQINQQREVRGWKCEHLLALGLNMLQCITVLGSVFVQILWDILLYIPSFTVSPESIHPLVISSLFAVLEHQTMHVFCFFCLHKQNQINDC